MINLRDADINDTDFLFELINDPDVVKNSIHNHEVKYEDHARWVEKALKDPSRKMFIIISDERKVGMITHFWINGEIETGISILKSERRQGYGGKAINLMLEDYHGEIMALVKHNNIETVKCFKKCGFKSHGTRVLSSPKGQKDSYYVMKKIC